jgi:hypothetical protein
MVHPIEIKPDSPFKPEHAHCLGLFDGKTFTPLAAPYTLSVLAGRNASRKLVTDEEGEKSYERAYALQGTRGSSHDRYVAMCKEEGTQVGASMIVIIWTADGCTLAEFPLFKTTGSYWKNKLLQAIWSNKVGLKVLIQSHYENQTTSPKSGNAYLTDKKFTQCEVVPLSNSQLQMVPDVANKFSAQYEAWLNR